MTADAETAATAPLPPRAVSAQTRLLLPFLFERRAADRAAEALAGASAGIARGLWTREPPRKLYRYRLEMTGHLDRFLFSHGEKGAVEGAYLHASGDRIQRWLGALDVDLGSRVARVGLASSPGVEIFLTAHGAGVLSLTFDLGSDVELDVDPGAEPAPLHPDPPRRPGALAVGALARRVGAGRGVRATSTRAPSRWGTGWGSPGPASRWPSCWPRCSSRSAPWASRPSRSRSPPTRWWPFRTGWRWAPRRTGSGPAPSSPRSRRSTRSSAP